MNKKIIVFGILIIVFLVIINNILNTKNNDDKNVVLTEVNNSVEKGNIEDEREIKNYVFSNGKIKTVERKFEVEVKNNSINKVPKMNIKIVFIDKSGNEINKDISTTIKELNKNEILKVSLDLPSDINVNEIQNYVVYNVD